jgi:hypothetical protein
MVSNLADGVSDEDIKELFESCGRVKYAGINWDRRCPPPAPAALSTMLSLISVCSKHCRAWLARAACTQDAACMCLQA